MSRTLALALATLALAPRIALPQEDDDLERAIRRVASAWARGDATAIANRAARSGLSIDLSGGPAGPLGTRQATAALRDLLADHETLSLRAGIARIVGGAPPRAFAELAWLHRARGTTLPERATIFLAFIREPDGWRITEIRLLR